MDHNNHWLFYALGSAGFAALTAIIGKLGVSEINSNLATFIRTLVIMTMTAAIVTVRGEWQPVGKLSSFGLSMLILSAMATGLSWLCYYRALQLGPVSRVASVDKLSVVLVIVFSVLMLREPLTWKIAAGGLLVAAGSMLIAW